MNIDKIIKKILLEETQGISSFMDEISQKFQMSEELKNFVQKFIEESECKKIEFANFNIPVLGLALSNGVLINKFALNNKLEFFLFVVLHEVAHQYQFKKYGEEYMYDCYLGDISDEVAAKFMKNTEEVADEFAGRKIRQLQKLNLINKNFTAPQMYKSVPLNQIIQMIRQYRNQMEMQNIDSPEKISEFFYNMVKSNL